MFKGSADRQTLVLGDVKTGVSTDVFHELPTKPGMSGTTIAEAGTPTNTFQYPILLSYLSSFDSILYTYIHRVYKTRTMVL